ncbi:uncharacterized protein N7482_006921 [Penicillium canariense]|uniref:Alpha/beta hydrolase fold-3 domain-containing protein n=1 Tax=Penicillium canariense TaxID=189055 RepID=A0A9W9LIM1_9EURO|nr:uncharacterized protein N7482_006921 [Penicillium canariense]KAJ5159917.1 hypothetical protein N7482_006921 [Penicillium canariense]
MDFENSRHLAAAAQKIKIEYLRRARAASISVQQAAANRDDPATGPVWVSKFTAPKPTDDTSRALLLSLVDEANEKGIQYDRPGSEPLHLEWTGFRANVSRDAAEPLFLEEQKFARLEAETKGPLTLLYIYGGSFTFVAPVLVRSKPQLIQSRLNTPSSYRRVAGSLAQATGSKVLMVRQRLAPQNPFPAALLDVFQAYLALLAPPPASPHRAVSPTNIVVVGDSSGACLALGLLQVLLRLKRRNMSIVFHGQRVEPVVPAGMALLSPAMELTNGFPSWERNKHCDIFPTTAHDLPYLEEDFPTCSIWPARQPRANLYCDAGMLAHSLASPTASDSWAGSCPLWFGLGQEQIADPARFVAQTAHKQGVSVTLHEYESMPHNFFWYLHQSPQARKLIKDHAEAIVSFAKGGKPPSTACFFRAKGLGVESMDIENLVPWTVAEAKVLMWKKTLDYKVPACHRRVQPLL